MAKKLVDLGVVAEVKSVSDCLSYSDWLSGRKSTSQMIDFYEYYLIRQGVPKAEAKQATKSIRESSGLSRPGG